MSKKSFRRVTLLLQQVLRCLNSSFRFPVGLDVEGTTGNMFEFPVFGQIRQTRPSRTGGRCPSAAAPVYHVLQREI